jgi:hypothetical protein
VIGALILWRRILHADFASIGYRPVIAGYLGIVLGLFLLACYNAGETFDRMRATGELITASRSNYIAESLGGLMVRYSLDTILPIAFVLVPMVAHLIWRRMFKLPTIGLFMLLSWVAAVALMQESKPFIARESSPPPVTSVFTDAATALRVLAAIEYSFVAIVWQQTRAMRNPAANDSR